MNKPAKSPDYFVGVIDVNARKPRLKKIGINLTNKSVKRVAQQNGCMRFILGDEEELIYEYGAKPR